MSGSAGNVAATIAGRALALLMRAILLVRRPRSIHSTGLLLEGSMRWLPRTAARCGVAWIDDRVADAEQPVIARFSRGAGLPAALPDVLGLAVRVRAGHGPADLLLSTTGLALPGRFLLQPRRTPAHARFSTLMPYRGESGPVLIAARTRTPARLPARADDLRDALVATPWVLEVLVARPRGRWHRVAELTLRSAAGPIDSAEVRFDPLLHAPPGAGTYAWTRLLREPSYARARAGSPTGPPHP
jgi:hypothetical protein